MPDSPTHLILVAPGQPTRTLEGVFPKGHERAGARWSWQARANTSTHADADLAARVEAAARAQGIPERALQVRPIGFRFTLGGKAGWVNRGHRAPRDASPLEAGPPSDG